MPIRPAVAADTPAVLPMVAALCAMHESWDKDKYPYLPDILELYRSWLPQRAADPQSVYLVAEVSADTPEQIAGFLVATVEREIPIYRIAEFGFIHDLWVEPPYRSRGIARHLVDAAVARFVELGIPQVRLDVAALNEPAMRLFASCGFRTSTTELIRTLAIVPGT